MALPFAIIIPDNPFEISTDGRYTGYSALRSDWQQVGSAMHDAMEEYRPGQKSERYLNSVVLPFKSKPEKKGN